MYSLLIFLLLAVYHDLKSYKIKNYLIVIGVLTGLIINLIELGLVANYPFLLATIIPIIILFPLFIIKAMGAGDIKLFSIIGSYLGVYPIIKIIIISFFVGGIMSIIYLIRTKSFIKRFIHMKSYITNLIRDDQFSINSEKTSIKTMKKDPYYQKERDGREGVIHFSLAIFAAFIIYIFITYFN